MSRAVTPQPVSGEGTVYSYTVNRQQWMPDMEVPYVLAVVELAEDPGLRLTTRLTGVDPSDVRIGLPVRVVFEQVEEIWLPLFTPHSKTSEEEAR